MGFLGRKLLMVLLLGLSACGRLGADFQSTSLSSAIEVLSGLETPVSFLGGTQKTITLLYTDPDGGSATACNTSGLTNVTVSTPCACAAGVCTVTVDGDTGKLGSSGFDFNVVVNGVTSANGRANITLTCPDNYVIVPGNATLGTSDYCMMKYEARSWNDANTDGIVDAGEVDDDGCLEAGCTTTGWGVATNKPLSIATAKPWRRITRTNAKALCTGIGAKYDLISNPEWMTAARNIENVAGNWSSGAVGTGMMVEGNAKSGVGLLAITDPNDEYDGTGDSPSSGFEHRRVFYLDNGEKIWDFSGNGWKWVDWSTGGALDNAPVCTTGGELTAVSCGAFTANDFNSSTGLLDSSHRAGKVVSGSNGGARRGGQNGDDSSLLAGIYTLAINQNNSFATASTLFRCVYRP